jgi:hypothetical protein
VPRKMAGREEARDGRGVRSCDNSGTRQEKCLERKVFKWLQ